VADNRERIIQATLRCVERWGLAKTSLEDVATAAELSRATVYRCFPGGRDQLVRDAVGYEVAVFLGRLVREIHDDEGLEAKLVNALVTGHRALGEHRLLHQVLSTEREVLLSELAALAPMVHAEVAEVMRSALDDEALRPDVDRDEAADYLARMFVSYLGSHGPIGAEPSGVARSVRAFLLGGILRP
jgi:AcrR family transcriptional regulator